MPNRSGWVIASDTPAENVKAARTPSTPATAPAIAGSTGTAERPRPGSRAKRAPTTVATGRPAPVAAVAMTEPRGARRTRPADSADQVRAAVATVTRSTATAQPGPRTSQFAAKPGSGSAIEASPIGVHSDAMSAAATPAVAPATAARPGATAADTAACRRVRPTACRTRRSTAAPEAYRAIVWPTRNRAASSAASPKASRHAASYPVDLRTGPPTWTALSHTSMSDRPVTRARAALNAGIAA